MKSPKDQIRELQNEVNVAVKWFEKNFWPLADERVKVYELDHYYDAGLKATPLVDYDRIKVPYPYRNARQILAEVYVKLPEPIVKPGKADKATVAQAEIAQPGEMTEFTPEMTVPGEMGTQKVDLKRGSAKLKAALEYCRDKSRLKVEAKMFVLDAVVTGLGIMMFSAQKDSKVPKYQRLTYKNVVFDPNVGNPYDSPWVARKIIRRLEEAKDDETYNKEARAALQASHTLDKEIIDEVTKNAKEQFAYTVIWDLWNKKSDQHVVWGEGGEKFLINEPLSELFAFDVVEDEFTTDWPFIFLIDEELLSQPLGMGDIAPILPQVKENDKIRTMQLNHIKRFHRKYGAAKGVLDEQTKEQLKQPYDGLVVEFKDDDWQAKFGPIQDAPLSQDIYRVGELIDRDIQTISPIGPNALISGTGQRPNTLGEAQIVEENSNTRLDEKRDAIADSFRRLFRLTAQFIQQYWVEEDVLRITGDGSKPTDWLTYSPDEVKGEYDYDVDPETMRDNTVLYRRQLAEALGTTAQLLAQINPAGLPILLRQYYETFPNLKTVLDQLIPEQLTQTTPENPDTAVAQDELLNLIQTQGPQAVLDRIKTLPDNERQAITNEVNRLVGQVGRPQSSAMTGSLNRI